jgi:hypothetical protein
MDLEEMEEHCNINYIKTSGIDEDYSFIAYNNMVPKKPFKDLRKSSFGGAGAALEIENILFNT